MVELVYTQSLRLCVYDMQVRLLLRPQFGGRLKVGRRALNPVMKVRVLPSEHMKNKKSKGLNRIKGEFLETKRPNGLLAGKEISRQRRWQIRNPERQKELGAKVRATEKYKIKARKYRKEYRRKNREKLNKRGRDYYYKNKERILEQRQK